MSNTITFPELGWEFTIDPVAFSIGGLKIYWYGILIALGMILAVVYCMYHAKRFGVDPDRLVDAALGGIIGGIIGARLYYVIFNITEFTSAVSYTHLDVYKRQVFYTAAYCTGDAG